jgi:hypothetical protein
VAGKLTASNTGTANQFTPSTATVSAGPEFAYSNLSTLSTGYVDITSSGFSVNVVSLFSSPTLKITLTDASFAGLTLSETSDNFVGGATATLSGSTITINVPAFQKIGTFSAQYSLGSLSTRVPDGGSSLAMLLGGMGLLAANRIRKNA